MRIIEIIFLIIPLFVILFLYASTALKLRWYLEVNHNEFVKNSDFPKKMSGAMYYSSPRTGWKWIRFVFSENDLNDPMVKKLKSRNKTVMSAAGILVVIFVSYCLWKCRQG